MAENTINGTLLLTGASGFIGKHAAQEAVNRGWRVRCLTRAASRREGLPPEVAFADGHLLDYASLLRAADGCSAVMHLAGAVKAMRTRDFYLINRDGTANLVKASGEAGVRRFLLCSSQAAAGPSKGDVPRRAQDTPEPVTEYGRSKLAGELALQAGAKAMNWCIIRPPAVYGPYDTSFLALIKMLRRGVSVRIGAGTRFSLVHCRDLARAMLLALETPETQGRAWFVTSGRDCTDAEFSAAAARILSVKTRTIAVPIWLASLIAEANERWAALRGTAPFFGLDKLTDLTQPSYTCDDSDFRALTGFRAEFDLERGLEDTIGWYQARGWI